MPTVLDSTIAHYKITAKLGQGGMGVVYRATDTKLDREVAIKVLPESFAQDKERLARFEREAKVLASLDHPNIGSIYGIEDAQGKRCLILQLIEGETLTERLRTGALPAEEALEVCRQIAEALETAHEKGIIHRDLKPGNVKITPDGKVKVLDFGLAKTALSDSTDSSTQNSQSPTLTADNTRPGVILGTAAYMSPEQARAKPVDKRSDIWSFGCVLFECLTGRRVFQGEDITETLATVIKGDPDWSALPSTTQTIVRLLLRKCLTKDRKQRLQDIGDARIDLEQAIADPSDYRAETSAPSPTRWKWALPWGLVAVLVAVIVLLISGRQSPQRSVNSNQLPRLTINLAEGVRMPSGQGATVTISPDGGTLIYVGVSDTGQRLYRREMHQYGSIPIPGTEGGQNPIFSPDGQEIVFGTGNNLHVQRVSISGGHPVTVCRGCDVPIWGNDGNIYFRRGGSIWRVPEHGGAEERVLDPRPDAGLSTIGSFDVLPGGRALLVHNREPGEFGDLLKIAPQSNEIVKILSDVGGFWYSLTGHILFARGNILFALPFDLDRLAVSGPEAAVLDGVRVENGGAIQASVSREGPLVYAPSDDIMGTELVWVDREGKVLEPIYKERHTFYGPQISPDGQHIVVQINEGRRSGVWIFDIAGGTLRRLSTPSSATSPVWSVDGQRIAFAAHAGNQHSIQWVRADGGGEAETLLQSENPIYPECFSSDGTQLILREHVPGPNLVVMDMRTKGTPQPFVATGAFEAAARLSHNGKWLAYTSDASGANEVFVRPFPGPGGETLVSAKGGSLPVWGADDAELFYLDDRNNQLSVASLQKEPFRILSRTNLFSTADFWWVPLRTQYDIDAKGQKFLMLLQTSPASRPRINVVLNWAEELRRLAPPSK